MRQGFDKGIIAGVLLLAAMIAGIAGTSYFNIRAIQHSDAGADHSRDVIDALATIRADTRKLQAAHRAFLISGLEDRLVPYREAAADLRAGAARLADLTADDPDHAGPAGAVAGQIEAGIAGLEDVTERRRAKGLDALSARARTGPGRSFVDPLLENLAGMDRAERARLAGRQVRARGAYDRAIFYDLASAALGLVALGLFVWVFGRGVRRRLHDAARLADQRELLSATLSSIGDAVIATDAAGDVTFSNAVAEALTGWGQDEARGVPLDRVFRIVNESTRLPVENPALRALKDGAVVGLANHTILIARDGTERPIDDSAAPIRSLGAIGGAVLVFRDITQRRRAEEELRRKEADLTDFIENATVGLHWVGPDGTILWANKAEMALLGYAREEYVGRNIAEFHADRRVIEDILCRLTNNEYLRGYEARLRCKDGSVKEVLIDSSVLWEGERFVHTRCFTRDVTEQKRSEEAQAYLMKLADALRPLTAPVDVQAAAARVLGEYLGANRVLFFEVRGPDYVVARDYVNGVGSLAGRYPVASFGEGLLAAFLAGRTVVEDDATAAPDRHGDARAAFAAIRVRGHVDVPLVKGGEFVAGMTVHFAEARAWAAGEVALVEQTAERTWAAVERARAEEALRESEERFRLMADAVPVLIWLSDRSKECIWFNKSWVDFAGRPMRELLGDGWANDVHPDDLDRCVRTYVANFDARLPFAMDYRLRRRDGEYRWVEDNGIPRFDGRGEFAGYIGSCVDFTERKNMEEALRDADRKKDDFIALLAHELRNPLAPIRNGLQVLRMSDDRGRRERAREMMDRQLAHMVRMIDDLLDASRIGRNKMELRRARVSLAEVVGSAVETARPAVEEAGHELSVSLPPRPVHLDADSTRLSQVVANLLTNSAKYTERGGRIWVSAELRGGDVAVSVRDTGIGIPADALPGIFDMFSQVDRPMERSAGGLGIGLALVKGLVEMHGGRVAVESGGQGMGSTFTVTLPVIGGPAADEAVPDEGREGHRPGRRVLVVDDNRDGAESLAMMLGLMGDEVRTAHDGLQAVEAAESFLPEVILMDVGMPRMNGLDATRRIRERPWGEPITIIALTGWGQEGDRERSREAGCDGHLVKPVNSADLQKLLEELRADRE